MQSSRLKRWRAAQRTVRSQSRPRCRPVPKLPTRPRQKTKTRFQEASLTEPQQRSPKDRTVQIRECRTSQGIEAPPSPTATTHSSRDTDPRDENGDIRSFVEGFDGFVTRLDTFLGPEPAIVAQRLGPHLRSLSTTLRALASTIAGYLETSADKEAAGEDMPEDLVPTLRRLLKAVPERGRSVPRSPHAGRASQS